MHRLATLRDVPLLIDFIFMYGSNQWNHLPIEPVRAHLEEIGSGRIRALLAESQGQLLGFISFQPVSREFLRYQPADRLVHAYVCEAVVHREAVGKGIGSGLLSAVVAHLMENGVRDIYIDRHADNAASAGMMRKAGFVELETYDDPLRRPNGSRQTTVCRLHID
ncbi:GNAT family N-acetyltransferase [Pseudomonas matsuisoli]|uniref:GNAT family N-acetyltransferase n=1 Tax=Pseudomonas matsuisoli TaxID=1515666 RepID=UPI003570B203